MKFTCGPVGSDASNLEIILLNISPYSNQVITRVRVSMTNCGTEKIQSFEKGYPNAEGDDQKLVLG